MYAWSTLFLHRALKWEWSSWATGAKAAKATKNGQSWYGLIIVDSTRFRHHSTESTKAQTYLWLQWHPIAKRGLSANYIDLVAEYSEPQQLLRDWMSSCLHLALSQVRRRKVRSLARMGSNSIAPPTVLFHHISLILSMLTMCRRLLSV